MCLVHCLSCPQKRRSFLGLSCVDFSTLPLTPFLYCCFPSASLSSPSPYRFCFTKAGNKSIHYFASSPRFSSSHLQPQIQAQGRAVQLQWSKPHQVLIDSCCIFQLWKATPLVVPFQLPPQVKTSIAAIPTTESIMNHQHMLIFEGDFHYRGSR